MAIYGPFSTLLIEQLPDHGILVVKFNRPRTKHSWTTEMFQDMIVVLRTAKDDQQVKVVILTSTSNFFSSGADLTSPLAEMPFRHSPVGIFMWDYIAFPKPIVASVSGGAVGIGATILLSCDIVYCSKDAYFLTPFARIGLAPEFGSSLLLREVVGVSVANEMLLAGKKLTAEEALRRGLVSSVYDTVEATMDAALTVAKQMTSFPNADKTLPQFKMMIRNPSRLRDLQSVLLLEFEVLDKCLQAARL